MSHPILVVAGGTGGHLSPGTALAEHINNAGGEVSFLSLQKNASYPDLLRAAYPVYYYNAPSLTLRKAFLFPFQLIVAFFKSLPVVRRQAAVVLMGGFPCLPAGLAALALGKPLFLCEQNAVMGRANRLFARWAQKVFLTFPLTGRDHSPNWPVLGNPLRQSFLQRPGGKSGLSGKGPAGKSRSGKKKATVSRPSSAFPSGKGKKILVAGGSQGALQINRMIQALCENQPSEFKKYRWVLQAGLRNEEEMKGVFATHGNIKVLGFDPDIHRFYEEADLLICRSGAGVLTEAFSFGLPMILIPYPYATDSHQKENAAYAGLTGAARIIDTRETGEAPLLEALESLDLKSMAKASGMLAKPDAAARIFESIQTELGGRD
ncbi:MAG: UDP-N-acetylglucosamine--N-acetylmuramyl-(pentapeptide) pyrophosphoryl-undecaprenol N-acetylglucosamine transferase [Leptospiraceae bacterium]|nr:UDP-N-acetylglucosamine--N-acetylmuramyl-(pentapeptide) pyrophosphoryl-undecaprenol N-acetylglucosamine transferase [Leptospiraceae bacterium]